MDLHMRCSLAACALWRLPDACCACLRAQWELYIPSDLAYGESQRGQHITPGAVLVFELEILEVKGPGQPAKEL
jgi:hypothetical protein